jgi:hypothetical protein
MPLTPLSGNDSVASKMLSNLKRLFCCSAKSFRHRGAMTLTELMLVSDMVQSPSFKKGSDHAGVITLGLKTFIYTFNWIGSWSDLLQKFF